MQRGCCLADRDEIIAAARAGGVVGARDGMPTHIRLERSAEIVIANGCECERLVFSDEYLMVHHAREVLDGLELAMAATGAKRGIIACVEADPELDEAVRVAPEGRSGIEVFHAPAFYPAGEEITLTYEATGRVPAVGAAAESVGVSVLDVETLYNLSLAVSGKPVTHRTVTVVGEVAEPAVTRLPLGAAIADAIGCAGGATVSAPAVVMGGPVCGALAEDLSQPITKATAALLVLPEHHVQVQKRVRSLAAMLLRARSACFQCHECTDHCTRYLMGQKIEPHKVMRAICYSLDNLNSSITSAVDCSECGVCDSFVCKMGISPRVICGQIRSHLAAMGWRRDPATLPTEVREEYAAGHITIDALVSRLGVEKYAQAVDRRRILHAEPQADGPPLEAVTVPLLQHTGQPAMPIVSEGDTVEAGQLIGEIPEGRIAARVHASAAGTVTAVGHDIEIKLNC
jgi:Na+-translocating ferredoxin:NAD+ oxidoreductase RnfC subunit